MRVDIERYAVPYVLLEPSCESHVHTRARRAHFQITVLIVRFVEDVLAIKSRADARLILNRARLLSDRLAVLGATTLPKVGLFARVVRYRTVAPCHERTY